MQTETPSLEPEETPKEQLPPYMEQAEDIRIALEVEETGERWKTLLSRVNTLPRDPSESKGNRALLLDLEHQYRSLLNERLQLAEALLAVAKLAKEKYPVSPVHRQAVLRSLARYLDSLHVYDHLLQGTIPTGTSLPESLAPYVRTHEEERFAVRTAETLLPFQYDVLQDAKVDASPRTLSPLSTEIAVAAVRRRLRMHSVIACLDEGGHALKQSDEPYGAFLRAAGYTEWTRDDLNATRLLIGHLAKHLDDIETFAGISGQEGGVKALSIAEALECCSGMQAAGKVTKEIARQIPLLLTGQFPDARAFTEQTLEEKDIHPQRMLQLALFPLTGLTEAASQEEKEQFQRNAEAVISFFRSFDAKRVRVSTIDLHIQHLNDTQKTMVRELCARATSGDMVQALLQASLVPTNEKDRSDTEKKVERELSAIFRQKTLSARDAYDLYLLSRTGKANTALAFKGINLLERQGKAALATEFQVSRFRKLTDMATSSLRNFDASLEQLNLTEEQERELRNIRLYLKEEGIDALAGWWNRVKALHRNFPWLYALDAFAAAGIATPPALLGRKVYITLRTTKLEKFANMGTAEAKVAYGLHNVPDAQIRVGMEEVTKILGEYDRLGRRFHLFRGGRLLRRANALMGAATTPELTAMATALKQRYPNVADVAERLSAIAPDEEALRTALREAGYSMKNIESALAELKYTAFERRLDDLLKRSAEIEGGPARGRAELRRRFIEEQVKPFQREFTALGREHGEQFRRRLASRVLGREISEGSELWKGIEKAHSEKLTLTKMDILEEALTKSGFDLADADTAERAKRLLRLGIVGKADEALELAAPGPLDELMGAVRRAGSPREVDELLNAAKNAKGIDGADLRRLRGARDLAGKTMRRANLARAGSRAAGAGLTVFGVLVDGYFMVLTGKEIEAAENAHRDDEARILRSKFRSQRGEALFGLGAGGSALAGVLSGPPGWVALGGLMAKSAASDMLYDYALELNRTNLREYLEKEEPELAGIIKGHADWLFEGEDIRTARHELALDAYLLKSALPFLSTLDEEHRLYFLNDIRQHLRERKGDKAASPLPQDLEEAISYAEHRSHERRNEASGLPAPAPFSPEAARDERTQELFLQLIMLQTLEREGELSRETAKVRFIEAAAQRFLLHDIHFYRSAVSGKTPYGQFLHENTIMEILHYTVGDLYDFRDIRHPEKFTDMVLSVQHTIRRFLGAGKTLDPTKQRGTHYGRRERPRLE